MPRNTPEQAEARRTQITQAAWRCFSRDGFHATSMDDVIREAGLSAGAVYRYFPGKAALVRGAVEQAFRTAGSAFEALLEADVPPPPAEAVAAVVRRIDEAARQGDADLGRLAVTAWGEALRDPLLAELAGEIYGRVRSAFGTLVERWQAAGQLPPGDRDELAAALFSLVPGYLLQRTLLGDVEAEGYARALALLLPGSGASDR